MEELNLNIDIDYSSDPFYSETWFLVLIALLLVFLLVLLIRGGKRSRRKLKAKKALKEALNESENYQEEIARGVYESGVSEEQDQ